MKTKHISYKIRNNSSENQIVNVFETYYKNTDYIEFTCLSNCDIIGLVQSNSKIKSLKSSRILHYKIIMKDANNNMCSSPQNTFDDFTYDKFTTTNCDIQIDLKPMCHINIFIEILI